MKTKLFFALTLIASFSCINAYDEELTKELEARQLAAEEAWLEKELASHCTNDQGYHRLAPSVTGQGAEVYPTYYLSAEEFELALQAQQIADEQNYDYQEDTFTPDSMNFDEESKNETIVIQTLDTAEQRMQEKKQTRQQQIAKSKIATAQSYAAVVTGHRKAIME